MGGANAPGTTRRKAARIMTAGADAIDTVSMQGAGTRWPMRFTLAHSAALLPGMPAGRYDLCCRTIDGNGIAQPMPRPLPRTGANGIHRVTLVVKG